MSITINYFLDTCTCMECTLSLREAVLSISFEVDVPTGKVGYRLLFERQRRRLPGGVWGHAPPENLEI